MRRHQHGGAAAERHGEQVPIDGVDVDERLDQVARLVVGVRRGEPVLQRLEERRDLLVHPGVLQSGDVELPCAAHVLDDGSFTQLIRRRRDDVDDDACCGGEVRDDAGIATCGCVQGRVDEQRDLLSDRSGEATEHGERQERDRGAARVRRGLSGHRVPFGLLGPLKT